MFVFILIGLSLVLLGIVGLQFSYMFYADRLHNERRRYIQSLEHRAELLTKQLEAAQKQMAEQKDLTERSYAGSDKKDEVWADILDER